MSQETTATKTATGLSVTFKDGRVETFNHKAAKAASHIVVAYHSYYDEDIAFTFNSRRDLAEKALAETLKNTNGNDAHIVTVN